MSTSLSSQSINTEFGKNRVQYHDDFDNWNKYETENFITFWYGKGRNIAEPVIQIAELNHDEVQNIMEHRMNDKIEIIVYTDVSDLKQSNLGLEDIFTSETGQTKIVGNKMFVYFDGSHQNLEKRIREGIASVYLNAMLFGDSFQEIVQNAVLLDVPQWFKDGIVSYAGSYWNHLVDDELRDILFQNDKYFDFEKLSEDYPRIAGHSLWFYLDQNYGRSSISNILYLTRITRNLDNALLYVINTDMNVIAREWRSYFSQHYKLEDGQFNNDEEYLLDLKNKHDVPVSILRISPDGQKVAYAYNKIGKYRIAVRDLNSGKDKVIFKYGHKNALQETDFNYPLLTWSPSSEEVTFVYEHKDVIKIRKYDLRSGDYVEQILPTDFQRIYNISYLSGFEYLMSATTDGYSDLYIYETKNRQYTRLTNDFYDDLDAEVVEYKGKKGILFSSNRPHDHIFKLTYDTIIPTGYFDLFFYDLSSDEKSVERLINTPEINERYPYVARDDQIIFLSSKSGMTNRYILNPNGTYTPNSNKERNIIRHHVVPSLDAHIYTYYYDGDYNIYLQPNQFDQAVKPFKTRFNNRLSEDEASQQEKVMIPFAPIEVDTLDQGLLFQSPYEDPKELEPIAYNPVGEDEQIKFKPFIVESKEETSDQVHDFNSSRITAARLRFRLDNFTTKMDNDLLFEGLESYTGNQDEILYNPVGLLFKANIKDVFEDYIFEGGARFPLSFDGSEYFLTFENRKKLIDKKFALYRRSQRELVSENVFPLQRFKKESILGMFQMTYPTTIYRSFRLTTQLRFDRFYLQSTDAETFGEPINSEKRFIAKLEYIYDNTIDIALNIKHGTRYKIFAEAINEFDFDLIDGTEVDLSKGFTTILGFDARHYIPFIKHSVIALRAAGATSLGNKRNLYYLGGVNNAFINPFNDNVPIPDGNFAYKTNIFQMRGFDPNVRNGTSYALINSEIRIPVFRYFMGNYGGSNFLRTMQMVMFYDVGTAWHGNSPYSDANPLNTETLESPPVLRLNISYFRDPLIMGFGAGIRMRLLGYYLRLDYARGIETRRLQSPKIHISMGMDF